MTPYLQEVPSEFWDRIANGEAFVDGSLVKDAVTKQILAHLQPTGQLTKALVSGPFGAIAAIPGVAANAQLVQIKSLLETVQTVATIGAAASVLNLGVSIGGFALVLSRLKDMDEKLDGIGRKLDDIDKKSDTKYRAKCLGALGRAEEAFELRSPEERLRYWRDAEKDLDDLVTYSLQQLVDRGSTAGLISSQGAWEVVNWLLSCASARIEIMLCLQEPLIAAKIADNIHQWVSGVQIPAKELAQQRLDGRLVSTENMQRVVDDAVNQSTFLSRSAATFGDRALLCKTLHDLKVDTRKYVMDVRCHPDPVMLMLSEPGG